MYSVSIQKIILLVTDEEIGRLAAVWKRTDAIHVTKASRELTEDGSEQMIRETNEDVDEEDINDDEVYFKNIASAKGLCMLLFVNHSCGHCILMFFKWFKCNVQFVITLKA